MYIFSFVLVDKLTVRKFFLFLFSVLLRFSFFKGKFSKIPEIIRDFHVILKKIQYSSYTTLGRNKWVATPLPVATDNHHLFYSSQSQWKAVATRKQPRNKAGCKA